MTMDPALQPISWCWVLLLGCHHHQMVFTRPEAHHASCFISRNTLGQLVNWSFFVDRVKKKLHGERNINQVSLVMTCEKTLPPQSQVVQLCWCVAYCGLVTTLHSYRRQVPGPTVNNGKQGFCRDGLATCTEPNII